MGLRGSLSDVGPLEAIQMIALQNRTGALTIKSGREKSVFEFVKGAVLCAHAKQMNKRARFVRLIEEIGLLEKPEIVHWLDEARGSDIDPVDVLHNLELMSHDDLHATYQLYMLGVLGKLLRPKGGRFHFHNAEEPRYVGCLTPVPADNLLLDGLRRRDEVDELLTGPLSMDFLPVIVAEEETRDAGWSPSFEEKLKIAIHSLCEGRWNLGEIIEKTTLPEYEIVTTLAAEVAEGRMRLVGAAAPTTTTAEVGLSTARTAAIPVVTLLIALGAAMGLRMSLEGVPAPKMGPEAISSPEGQSETSWRREEASRQGEMLLREFLDDEA